MKKRLQVLQNGKWEYVFCYSGDYGNIVITKDKQKALPGIDIDFFSNKFGNDTFRVITS